jgi:predicted PurR-regulated permease PerM
VFKITHQGIFIFFTALTLLLLYLLAPMLTPFLLGALLAYLTNPLVKKLEKFHLPHLLSVTLCFLFLIFLIVSLLSMLFPLVQKQIILLIDMSPQIVYWIEDTILPWLKESTNITTLKATLSSSLPKAGWIFGAMLQSGYTIIGWIVDLVLTPIVFFYLLRDWDRICELIKDLLPKSISPTVVKLARECDEVLGAFFRGQLLVILALALIYGVGLSLAGLNVGMMLGIIGGLLSIVPYLGSAFVVVSASATALVQFGTWHSLIGVLIVFLVGQGLEGYVLTPYLIGERIGLHPVVVIFAILAGGTLFGFFGVLLALPVSAVIKVLLKFIRKKYMHEH